MSILSGLNLFDFSRFVFVFGFTLIVIRYTNSLTVFKSPRAENRKKLLALGIGGCVAGITMAFVGGFSPIQSEAISIKGIGLDIIAIGFSCIFQSLFYTQKQQSYLVTGGWVLIAAGFFTGIFAVLANVFHWL
jgi:hypothetical protein